VYVVTIMAYVRRDDLDHMSTGHKNEVLDRVGAGASQLEIDMLRRSYEVDNCSNLSWRQQKKREREKR